MMKALLVLTFAVAVASLKVNAWTAEEKATFQEFVEKFKKVYGSEAEELEAMTRVLKNKKKIDAHNKLYDEGKVSYTLGLFQYSDLSPEQFNKQLLGTRDPKELEAKRTKRNTDQENLSFLVRNTNKIEEFARQMADTQPKPNDTSFITRMILAIVQFIQSLLESRN